MKKELKSSFFYENESVIGTPLTNGEADVTVCVAGPVCIKKNPPIVSTKNYTILLLEKITMIIIKLLNGWMK
jgi:hypothetical protein